VPITANAIMHLHSKKAPRARKSITGSYGTRCALTVAICRMSRYDFTAQRLYVNAPLAEGVRVELDHLQTNYVRNVLRLSEGAAILVFNGATANGKRLLRHRTANK